MERQQQGYTIYAKKLVGEDRNSFNDAETFNYEGARWLIFWDVKDMDKLPPDADKLCPSLKTALTEIISASNNPDLEEISLSFNERFAQIPANQTPRVPVMAGVPMTPNNIPFLARAMAGAFEMAQRRDWYYP